MQPIQAKDPIDTIFDVSSTKSKITKDYNSKPLMHYQLDAQETNFFANFDAISKALHGLNNILWYLNLFVVKLIIVILDQAYTLDLLGSLVDKVDSLVSGIKTATWDRFANTFIVIAAIVALVNYLFASRKHRSWEQLISLILLIMISVYFFAKPADMLRSFNEISKEASADVLTSTMPLVQGKVEGIDDAVVVMGNTIWKNHVLYPWYNLQFGSIDSGKSQGRTLLNYSPLSDEREDFVKEQIDNDNDLMKLNLVSGLIRFLLIILYLVYTLLSLFVIAVLSVLMQVYQFIPIILFSITGLIFLVSLFPGMGFLTIHRWLAKIASAFLNKIAISIFLSVYMIVASVMYEAFQYNLLYQLIALFVAAVALILERKRIMGMFQSIPNGAQAVAAEANRPFDYKDRFGRRLFQAIGLAHGGKMLHGAMKSANNARQRKKLRPDAYNYLNNKYQKDKQLAEERSLETGKPVQYSDFVKQVDERMEQGLPLYTGTQIDQATETLRDIKKQKGDFNKLYLPTGVNTTDPNTYTRAALAHQQSLEKKQQIFDEKRFAHRKKADQALNHLNKFGTIPQHDTERAMSNEVRQRQELARTNGLNAMLNTQEKNQGMSNKRLDSFLEKQGVRPESSNMIHERQELARAMRRNKPSNLFTVGNGVGALTNEQALEQVRSEWDISGKQGEKQDFFRNLKQEQRSAFGQLKHLQNYQTYEQRGELNKFGAMWPAEMKEIEGLKASTGKNITQLINEAQKQYDNSTVKLSAARQELGDTTSSFVAIKAPKINKPRHNVDIVNTPNAIDANTIVNRQDIARAMRRNPPRSTYMIQQGVPDYNPSEIKNLVTKELKDFGNGKAPGAFVDVLYQQENAAKQELQALKVYQKYEVEGKLGDFKAYHSGPLEQISKLKSSTKLDTKELIKLAEKNVKNLSAKTQYAKEHLNLSTKEVIKVNGKEMRVKSPSDYEKEILFGPKRQNVEIQVDDVYKQSVINDWNKHQEQHNMSKEQYIRMLADKKKEVFSMLQTFKKAKDDISISPETRTEYEEMFQRHRSAYLDAKERHSFASSLLGIEKKQFKPRK